MSDTKLSWPSEYYESGEAMPDSAEVDKSYGGPQFMQDQIARARAMMTQNRQIEPLLKYFVETGYRAMNKMLRGEHLRKRDLDFASVQMAKLDEALVAENNRTVRPMLVYRGIAPEFAASLVETLKRDGKFSDVGYIIASTVPRQTPFLMQIELPGGTPYLSLNKFLPDDIVLPHGGHLQAIAYHELPQHKVRVVARWLGTKS